MKNLKKRLATALLIVASVCFYTSCSPKGDTSLYDALYGDIKEAAKFEIAVLNTAIELQKESDGASEVLGLIGGLFGVSEIGEGLGRLSGISSIEKVQEIRQYCLTSTSIEKWGTKPIECLKYYTEDPNTKSEYLTVCKSIARNYESLSIALQKPKIQKYSDEEVIYTVKEISTDIVFIIKFYAVEDDWMYMMNTKESSFDEYIESHL